MSRYDFLVESYRTERLKTLSVWSQIPDARMTFRPEPRARTPLEHMVHQCVSEDTWMRTMLGVIVSLPALPQQETRPAFLQHYAAASGERLARIESQPDAWFEAETTFFDVNRSAADALRSPSRAVDGVPAFVGAGALFDVRADGRYRRPLSEQGAGYLSLRVS